MPHPGTGASTVPEMIDFLTGQSAYARLEEQQKLRIKLAEEQKKKVAQQADSGTKITAAVLRNMSMSEYSKIRNDLLYDKWPDRTLPERRSTNADGSWPTKTYTVGTYTENYWAFVNAKTQDAADTAFQRMIQLVSMDLEPRPDGKSWVEDPVPEKAIVKPKSQEPIIAFIVICGMFLLLHIIGVLS